VGHRVRFCMLFDVFWLLLENGTRIVVLSEWWAEAFVNLIDQKVNPVAPMTNAEMTAVGTD
jgi:hypothetical protein